MINSGINLVNGKYITIGENTIIGRRVVLNAWDKYEMDCFSPEIIIGNGVSIGDDNHITAIKSIRIGDNVLIGKKVTITDNSHGRNDNKKEFFIPPIARSLYSKGEVLINDNVWIGDKVTILPGVTIGFGAIIGSNSVVTCDVPPFAIAVGMPARVVRTPA
ncbi:acyltransferase [Arcticibacter tournemirensis]|uniref:Acyltransferase n=2 Tax=Arcticibacter tournemirensis TaxID=699437 RepID=A0A5M9HAR6_9SPHI|nr:acyltransferase [Arcticibacter tournemirensis]KAA8482097.1 acyltransferase [Arcticibacter tournemirensis]